MDPAGLADMTSVVIDLETKLEIDQDPGPVLSQLDAGMRCLIQAEPSALTNKEMLYLAKVAVPRLVYTLLKRHSSFSGALSVRSLSLLKQAAILCARTVHLELPEIDELLYRLFTETFYLSGSRTVEVENGESKAAQLDDLSESDSDSRTPMDAEDVDLTLDRQEPRARDRDSRTQVESHAAAVFSENDDECSETTLILPDDSSRPIVTLSEVEGQDSLGDVFKAFADAEGLSMIMQRLIGNPSLTSTRAILRPLHRARYILKTTEDEAVQIGRNVRTCVFNILMEEDEEMLKSETKIVIRDILHMVNELFGTLTATHSQDHRSDEVDREKEIFELSFALKRLKSRFLEQRLGGLSDMRDKVLKSWTEREAVPSFEEPTIVAATRSDATDNVFGTDRRNGRVDGKKSSLDFVEICDWLKTNKIIKAIFDVDRLHSEVLKRSSDILRCMAISRKIDSSDLEAIVHASSGAHESIGQELHSLISEIPKCLEPSLIDWVWRWIRAIPMRDYDHQTVKMIANFTMHALSRRSLTSSSEVTLCKSYSLTSHDQEEWYGVNLFWELCQDEAEAPMFIFTNSFGYLKEFMSWSICSPRRISLFYECFTNVSEGRSQPQSYQLMASILASYPKADDEKKSFASEFLMSVECQHGLLDRVIADLETYHKEAEATVSHMIIPNDTMKCGLSDMALTKSSKWSHLYNITERLLFLSDCFLTCLAPEFRRDQLERIWSCAFDHAIAPSECDHLFKWLEDLAGTFVNLEDHSLMDFIFDELLCKVPPERMSRVGLSCFEMYFRHINSRDLLMDQDSSFSLVTSTIIGEGETSESSTNGFVVRSIPLKGTSTLWSLALEATDHYVCVLAALLLQKLYNSLSFDLRNIQASNFIDFIETVMNEVRKLYSKERDLSERDILKLSRCISLLRGLVGEFLKRASNSGPSRFKRHGSCSRGDPLRIGVLVISGPKFEIETFSNESLGSLKERIMGKIHTLAEEEVSGGSMRVMTSGKELKDDSKTMNDLRIEDRQQFHVTRPQKSMLNVSSASGADGASLDSPPIYAPILDLEERQLPNVVLSETLYFDLLFELLSLNDTLSSQVWELLMVLPTNTKMLNELRNPNQIENWDTVLNHASIHRLLYTLQIVDYLDSVDEHSKQGEIPWREQFIRSGGFDRLITVTLDVLDVQNSMLIDNECLALLLRTVRRMLLREGGDEHMTDDYQVAKCPAASTTGTIEEDTLRCLINRLLHASMKLAMNSSVGRDQKIRTVPPNEAVITKCASQIAIALAISSPGNLDWLTKSDDFRIWLSTMLLYSPSEKDRHCAAQSIAWVSGSSLGVSQVLRIFLLPMLENDLPHPSSAAYCSEYFKLARFLLSLLPEYSTNPSETGLDVLNSFYTEMCRVLSSMRPSERSSSDPTDELLVGLLETLNEIFLNVSSSRRAHQGLCHELFHRCLFSYPASSDMRQSCLPMCRTKRSRKSSLDLLLNICKNNAESCRWVLDHLIEMHENIHSHLVDRYRGDSTSTSWVYCPQLLEKSTCGYVGLKNLGSTCYVNSLVQQLFMIPQFRDDILAIPPAGGGKVDSSLLLELQSLFGFLLMSEKKYYDTSKFCSICTDIEGQPLNTNVQMDVDEFLNALFDKLEVAVKGTDMENILKNRFGGKVLNQVICQDVDYISEREEDFYVLSLEVKKTLLQSLEFYVKGELLDGDNMYYCSPHGKHVVALKRTCIGKLPNTLIIHLKRFEFDFDAMRKVKVNELCEFPIILDLHPYTKSAIMKQLNEGSRDSVEQGESTDENLDMDDFRYELVGILVHSGNADSGHYYSYVKERDTPTSRWIQFNDTQTELFDPREIPRATFGGSEPVNQWDPAQQKNIHWWQPKNHSAYMLFYEKIRLAKDVEPPEDVDKAPFNVESHIPRDVFMRIWSENRDFSFDKYVFDADYNLFAQSISRIAKTWSLSHDIALGDLMAMFGSFFVLDCVSRYEDRESLGWWSKELSDHFCFREGSSKWMIEKFTSQQSGLMHQVLLECSTSDVRSLFANILKACINCLSGVIPLSICTDTEEMVSSEISRDDRDDVRFINGDIFKADSILGHLLEGLLRLIDHNLRVWSFEQLFEVLLHFCNQGVEARQFLVRKQTIALLIDFYLEDESPVASRTHRRAKKSKMDERAALGNLGPMFEILAVLVCSCCPSGPPSLSIEESSVPSTTMRLTDLDRDLILCTPFIVNSLKDGLSTDSIVAIYRHVCRDDERASNAVIDAAIKGLDMANFDAFKPYFDLITAIIEIEDSLLETRLERMLSAYIKMVEDNRQYKYATSHAIRYLGTIIEIRPVLTRAWFISRLDLWLGKWLLRNAHGAVRKETAKFVEAMISSCSQGEDYGFAVVVWDSVYGLLPSAIAIAKESPDEAEPIDSPRSTSGNDPSGRFCSLFRCLAACGRNEQLVANQVECTRIFAHLGSVLELAQVLIGRKRDNDESVIELVNLLLAAMEFDNQVALAISFEEPWRALVLCMFSLLQSSSLSVDFATKMAPAYFSLLHAMITRHPSFSGTVVKNGLLTYAVKHFWLHSSYTNVVQESLFKILEPCLATFPEFRARQTSIVLMTMSDALRLNPELNDHFLGQDLQYLIYLTRNDIEPNQVVIQSGLGVLLRYIEHIGSLPESKTNEFVKELGLCCMLVVQNSNGASLARELRNVPGIARVAPRLMRFISVAPRWRASLSSAIQLFTREDEACAESLVMAIVEDSSQPPHIASPAVSPASESREQLEHLTFRESDKDQIEFGRSGSISGAGRLCLPDYITANEQLIRMGCIIVTSYGRWKFTQESKHIPFEFGRIVAMLLCASIGVESAHAYMAQLAFTMMQNPDSNLWDACESLIRDPYFDEYPRELLLHCVPEGSALSTDFPIYLIEKWCALKGTFSAIPGIIRPQVELPEIVRSMGRCVEAISKREGRDKLLSSSHPAILPLFSAVGILVLLCRSGLGSVVNEMLATNGLHDQLVSTLSALEEDLAARFKLRLDALKLDFFAMEKEKGST